MLRGQLSSFLFSLVPVLLASCATPPAPVVIMSGPSQWTVDIDQTKSDCEDINAVFLNLGERYDQVGLIKPDGLLAEHVFVRRLPRGRIAQSVDIQSNIAGGWLDANLIGAVSRKIGFAVSCQAGWHVLVETRSGQYLGGGVEQQQFRQMSYFRQDRQGRLVARVQTSATMKSDQGEVSQQGSENWFRFEVATRESN